MKNRSNESINSFIHKRSEHYFIEFGDIVAATVMQARFVYILFTVICISSALHVRATQSLVEALLVTPFLILLLLTHSVFFKIPAIARRKHVITVPITIAFYLGQLGGVYGATQIGEKSDGGTLVLAYLLTGFIVAHPRILTALALHVGICSTFYAAMFALNPVFARECIVYTVEGIIFGGVLNYVMSFIYRFKYYFTQQNRDMAAILDNIQIGIFSLSQPSLDIDDSYSYHFSKIFAAGDERQELNLRKLIFQRSSLNPDQVHIVQGILANVIGEDALTFELNRGQLPQRFSIQRDGQTVHLSVEWDPILDQHGRVQKVLVACKDVTDMQNLEREKASQEKRQEKIWRVINAESRRMRVFFSSSRTMVAAMKQHLLQLVTRSGESDEQLRAILFTLHSLKGNARSLDLSDLASLIHGLESALAEFMKSTRTAKKLSDIQTLFEEMVACLDEYSGIHNTFSANSLGERGLLSAPMSLLNKIALHFIHQTPLHEEDVKEVLGLSFMSMEDVFQEASHVAKGAARELGKKPPQLVSSGLEGVWTSMECGRTLLDALSHMMRNSLDHGIEDDKERVRSGKAEQGRISFACHLRQHVLEIVVGDDGRGLALTSIKETALKTGYIQPDVPYSDQQIAAIIFCPSFTTSKELTQVSGRGVGMAAVDSLLKSLEGSIEVEFTDHNLGGSYRNFELRLTLPKRHFVFRSSTVAVGPTTVKLTAAS